MRNHFHWMGKAIGACRGAVGRGGGSPSFGSGARAECFSRSREGACAGVGRPSPTPDEIFGSLLATDVAIYGPVEARDCPVVELARKRVLIAGVIADLGWRVVWPRAAVGDQPLGPGAGPFPPRDVREGLAPG